MQRIPWIILLLFSTAIVQAGNIFDYRLEPVEIAKDTYVFIGKKEDFSVENGGNIVNTGFIVTEAGVIVIDTGPSLFYGQQMRAAIGRVTDLPIIKVLITHHHPDHIFGNQAYAGIPIFALPRTTELIRAEAAGFLDNLYRMVGYWMKDTEAMTDVNVLENNREIFPGHTLNYLAMSGHTESDLMVFDETTGVLFTGDLVFHNRAPTTPHANPESWQAALKQIEAINYSLLVPGHGEISASKTPVEQTREYLVWLEQTIRDSVMNGLEMNEVLLTPLPEKFQSLAVLQREFTRSVTHRYPIYEAQIFN